MGLFNFILKRILYKIPLKLLLVITIALILLLLFNSKVFAVEDYSTCWNSTTYNDNFFRYYLPEDVIDAFKGTDDYTSGNYNYLWWYDGARYNGWFWEKTNDIKFYNTINESINRYNYFFHSGNSTNFTCKIYQINPSNISTPTTYRTDTINHIGQSSYKDTENKVAYFYTNMDIYVNQNVDTIFLNGVQENVFVDPYISDTSRIDDMSFNYLMIEGGSEDFYFINSSEIQRQRIFDLELDYQGYTYVMNINDYAVPSSSGDVVGFAIPKYALFPQLIFRNGETLAFSLVVTPSKQPNSTGDWSVYSLGTFTLTLTTEQEQQLEEDRQAQQMDDIQNGITDINNSVTNVNNSVNNLTDTITDGDIDDDYADDFLDLSTNFAVEDPTSLDQIFMILYNAFCEDEIEDLTFTMPFTNQQVTISQQNISARYPQAVKSIVAVFVWGIIGLFVLKDIRSSVNKIAEGSPEDVGSDVKKEVL